MFERIRALLHRLSQAAEVDALSDRDLYDLGLSRDQLKAFLRMPEDTAERVTSMGAIFGVPDAELKRDHALWVELLTVCGQCSDRGACKSVLEKGALAMSDACNFCGNRASFAGLAACKAPIAA